MKIIWINFFLAFLFLTPVLAAEVNLLEPTVLPGSPSAPTASQYIGGAFQTAILVGAIFAILNIIVGGIQYIASGIPGIKMEAKGRINNSFLGLLILLSIWIILNQINPELVKLKIFNIKDIPPANPPAQS